MLPAMGPGFCGPQPLAGIGALEDNPERNNIALRFKQINQSVQAKFTHLLLAVATSNL